VSRSWLVIGGANGSGNFGDEAMWLATARLIRELDPSAEIITDGWPGFTPAVEGVTVLPFLFRELARGRRIPGRLGSVVSRPLRDRYAARRSAEILAGRTTSVARRWDDAIARSSGVVFSGAGAICDQYAVFGVHSWSLLAQLAERQGVPYLFLGQGIGPLDSATNRMSTARMLKGSVHTTCRSKSSRDLVVELGVPESRVSVGPDWACMLTPTAEDERRAAAFVGALRSPRFIALSFHRRSAVGRPPYSDLAKVVGEVVAASHDPELQLVFVPNMRGSSHNDDCRTAEHVIELCQASVRQRAHIYREPQCAGSVRAVIALSQGLISTRYHPAVFAMADRVPVASLAYDPYYELKHLGLAESHGIPNGRSVLGVRKATGESVVRVLRTTRPAGITSSDLDGAASTLSRFISLGVTRE